MGKRSRRRQGLGGEKINEELKKINALNDKKGQNPKAFSHLITKLADKPYGEKFKDFDELMKEGEDDGES